MDEHLPPRVHVPSDALSRTPGSGGGTRVRVKAHLAPIQFLSPNAHKLIKAAT